MSNQNINDLIFDFCYEMALRDSTMRKSYSGKLENLRPGKDKKDANAMRSVVRRYIDSLHGDMNSDQIINVINKVIKASENIDKCNSFSFGNAQKLVNMTAKYMYIAVYQTESLRKKYRNCHCPMDSIIVDKLICDIKKQGKTNEAISSFQSILRRKDRAWISFLKTPLCKVEEMHYMYFQYLISMVKDEDISLLEYDYYNWRPNSHSCNI